MTKQFNFAGGIETNASRAFRQRAAERAQAEEMEIKEMDPNGNTVIATEQGVTEVNNKPEDSLYFEDNTSLDSFVDEETEKPREKTWGYPKSGTVYSMPHRMFDILPDWMKDALFDAHKGIVQTFSGMNSGEVMRSQQTIDELDFMEKALGIEEAFKKIDKQLNDAYLAQDTDAVRKLYPQKKNLFDAYETILPDLNKAKRKYWEEIMKQPDKYEAIKQYRNELLENNEVNLADMERWNNYQNYIDQNVHKVSEEWEKGKEGEYGIWYQLPNALGTSASSLGVSVATGAVAAATNAIAASPALSTGPAGAGIVGGAALLTFGASTVGALWARNQESLSEVSNNYMSAIQQYAQKHNIDTSEVIAEGRRKLQELTGSYSDDPNSPEYRDDSQVLTGMLSYNIPFNDLELEKASIKSRRRLDDVYNRNMMLGVSDIAQNFVMIPGMGKLFNKTLQALNPVDNVIDATVTVIDDVMRYTAAKVGKSMSESVAKRTAKYIVDPTVRVGFTGLSEGFEELSQYMYGRQMDPDYDDKTANRSDINLFNPIDFLSTSLENTGMLLKGVAALAGKSKDDALNNDEELVTNFKIGALVGMLMGGVSQFNETRKNFNDYNRGMRIARQMVADHVDARETMFRYNQYAEKALGGHVRVDAMLDGFDTAIASEHAPAGWDKSEFEKEKNAVRSIFNLIDSPYIQKLPEEHRAAGAAYLQYTIEQLNAARRDFAMNNNVELQSKLQQAVDEFCTLHGIDNINAPLLQSYFETKQRLDAIRNYEKSWEFLNGYTKQVFNDRNANKLINLKEEERRLQVNLDILEDQLKKSGLYDKATGYGGLVSVADDINRNEIEGLLKKTAMDTIEDRANKILNDPNKLLEAVKQYKQSIEDNKAIEENVRQVEDENIDAKIELENNAEEEAAEEVRGTGLSTSYVPDANPEESPEVGENAEEGPFSAITKSLDEREKSQFEEESKDEEDDYDGTGEKQLTDEMLNNDTESVAKNFEETIIDETRKNKEEIQQLREENEQLKQTIAQFEQKFSELDKRINELKQGLPHSISEEDETMPERIEPIQDDYNEEEPESDVTLFYNPVGDEPMLPGYGTGAQLNTLLSTPGMTGFLTFSAWVDAADSKYGTYNPNDRSTWDNAAVYVEIVGPDGLKYLTALKTIDGARANAVSKGKTFTAYEENNLRNMRNTIIAAKLADPNAVITFDEVRFTAGKLNNLRIINPATGESFAPQRKLTEIKGLNLPEDLHDLFNVGIQFGYGTGMKGKFIIKDGSGNVLPGIGNFGTIYIYPAQSSMISGQSRPIQLTSKRFEHTTGDTKSFAYQISKALLFGETDIEGIPVEDILQVMLNYGNKTILPNENEPSVSHLVNKQFAVSYANGTVKMGKDTFALADMRNNDGIEKMARFIADNLHWNTEKNIMFPNKAPGTLPASFKQYLNREGVMNRDGVREARLFNGELVFDEMDTTLSGMAFLIKHGYITSDLADLIFTSPFVYVSKPRINTQDLPFEGPSAGTNNNAVELLLNAGNDQIDYEVDADSNPYTDPNSNEVSNFFGDIDGAPKTVDKELVGKATKKVNEKQARKWLSKKLGIAEEDVEVVDGVIRTLANGKAVMGVAKRDSIMLSSEAAYGVQYHEAWHRVSLLMLSPEQRQRLYKEFRKSNPRYKHASDKVVEETIADQFMEYMVANDKEGIKYYLSKWFRKIKHWIGINAKVDHYSLQEMFKAVRYGELAKYRLNEESLKLFDEAYKHGANYEIGPNKNVKLASINSPYEYQQLLNSLKSIVVVSNGLKYVSQIQNLDTEKTRQFLINRLMSPRLTTEQKQVLGEVVNNFDTIMKDLQPIMEKMGIREIDETQDEDLVNREEGAKQHYDKAAYEFSKKDNALGSAKIFLSTIPDTYYTYKEGIKYGPIPRISSLTGLPLTIDYDTAYAKVLRFLSGVETFAPTNPDEDYNLSIIGKCKMLGEFDPFFEMLYRRLINVDINTETQLLLTIKSFNQNFQEINYKTDKNGNTEFSISDSINRRAVKNKPVQWSEMFFNSRFVKHDNDRTYVDVSALTDMKNRFNNLHHLITTNAATMDYDKYDTYLNTLIEMFNELGINVDRETFDFMLGNGDKYQNLVNLVNNRDTGSTFNFFNIQLDVIATNKPIKSKDGTLRPMQLNEVFITNMKSIVNTLAEFDVQVHPSENEISVLGPNNNVIFTKTLNNFVSDQVRWLNNHDPLVMSDFENDPYCHSSLIYNTVKANGKIQLNTFVNFYGLNKNDKGRDYVSISPVEDYIAKMVFTQNNHIIFPTMADKKTWYTISGCTLFNRPLKFTTDEFGKRRLEFDVNVLDHVYNEWLDEYNTIVEYWNTVANITNPINNYHTKGKGGLFRHHTGYYKTVNGELKWVDLNKKISAAIKTGDRYDKGFGRKNKQAQLAAVRQVLEEIKEELFTDRKATYQKINDNLSKERQFEIKKCVEMNIVEMKNGILSNKLLDSKKVKDLTELYKQSEHEDVRKFALHYAIVTLIGNHMVNTNISIEETEKMFTGDVAFFKNNDDKIKRLGAVLSTGDNMRTQWMQSTIQQTKPGLDRAGVSKAWLDKTRVENRRTYLQNRQTYTSTVINDNMIQSQQYDLLEQMFTQYYIRQLLIERGLSEADIDALSDNKLKEQYPDVIQMAQTLGTDDASAYGLDSRGKGAINQADAAVYISPQMYKDIVQMLGEWNDEIEEAYDIMESGIDWLSDRTKCAKAMKALIKPLKTTYFCNQYNADIKHTVPVFDKMAMFPLFRVIATGDNKEIYDRMNALGKYAGMQKIDQVAFESAKKVGIISPSDVYTDYTNTEMNDLSNMHVVTQRFRNLRRQLITDPHTHDRTLFGTQVSTVAVSNLVLDRVYQQDTPNEKTGEDIMKNLFGTINAISNKGIQEVAQMYLSPDGKLDLEKTSMELVKKAHSQNMGKDVEEALQLNETKDDFKIPLSALPDNKWIETALISDVNKKAVDLELPGGAFIQMSSFGINSIKVVSSSEYHVNNGKRLVNMNPDGSMDAVISINLLKHIIPGYNKMSFMEARQWLIDNKVIGDDAEPAALGYRIPTQGLSSIAGIRISDVLPPVVGDTIILPDEFTAQTGSDFDIDKLYIARYNYEEAWVSDDDVFDFWYKSQAIIMAPDERGVKQMANRFENRAAARIAFVEEKNKAAGREKYRIIGDVEKGTDIIEKKIVRIVPFDPALGYDGNSREANENLLLRTYLDVLTDSKNVGETRLPLDKTTGIIKDEILPIVDGSAKLEEIVPYKELSPSYQISKKYEYNGGKAGIGPFALNNKNHILTQLTKLKFKENELLKKLGFTGLDGMFSRDENVIARDKHGNKLKNEDGSYKYVLDKGVRILDWLSAMINAHVDVAKDPYVIRLNVCQYTYNICNFLLRAGYGKSTFFFLPQPILKEMAAAYDNASGNYGVDATKSKTAIVNEAIQQIRQKYVDKFKEVSERLNKKDIIVEVGVVKGVDIQRVYVEKDETGNNVEKKARLHWGDDAVKMMDRDFLIDQLMLLHKEQMTDEEAYDFYLNQLRISMIFESLNDKAEDMSKLVQLSQIDTKRYGNNFVEQDRFIYRWKAFLVNTTLFKADDVLNYFDKTFLYTKLINGVVTPQAIFDGLLFRGNRQFLDSITKALMLTIGLEHNNEQLNKTIANEFEALIRCQFLTGKVNIDEMFYGLNTMAKRLNKIKTDILSGRYPKYRTQDGKITNGLLNHLDVLSKLYTDNYDAPQIITRKGFGENDKNLNNLLKEYWAELLNDTENNEIREFAKDLVLYMLLTTGGNHTKNGIFNLIPVEHVIESGYSDFIKSATGSFAMTDIDFDAFFLNNWRNDKLVKPMELTETVYDQFGRTEKDKFPIVYFFDDQGARVPVVLNPRMYSKNQNVNKDPVFQPFIKVRRGTDNNPANTFVYKFVGVNQAELTPVYVLVNKLGINQNGRVIKEYHTGNAFKSELEFNNHPLANIDIFGDTSGYKMLPNDRKFLERLMQEVTEVRDYMPTTQALRMTLTPAITRQTTKESRTQNIAVRPAEQLQKIAEDANIVENNAVDPVENIEHTFTFPNGFTVKTGFKLNDQQIEALNTLADFVDNPTKYDGRITLSGYAGTGKTTILRFLDQYMKSRAKTAMYAAPTHRAKTVMNMSNPNAEAQTLHAMFGLRPEIDVTRDVLDLKDLKTNMTPEAADKIDELHGLLIIDESSMIDDSFYQFLQEVGKVFDGIVFVGDDAQLSPVQHEDGRISKVFSNGGTVLKLTKVERTGDNPILKECTNLRNGLPFTYRTHIVNGEGVTYFDNDSLQEVKDIMLKEFAENDPDSNPLHFRIIAGTNDVVAEMNEMYREAVIGDSRAPIQKGEILMGYTNIKEMRVEILNNSLDYVVLDAGPERMTVMRSRFGRVEFKGQMIVIQSLFDRTATPTAIQVISKNNSPLVYLTIAEINKKYHDELNLMWKKGDRRGYAKLKKEFNDFVKFTISMDTYKEGDNTVVAKAIDFGYAHTIHKSQGGTYNKTMVFESSIDNTKFEEQTKQQLRYVAMSRAKQNVWVVTSHKIGEEIKPVSEPKMVRTKTDVTRAQAMKTPNVLYIFTDNTNRTSGSVAIDPDSWYSQKYRTSVPLKYPTKTSARIRGLENARPISTQRWYNLSTGQTREKGRWNDSDFELFKNTIDDEIQDIKEAWDSGKYEKVIVATPAGILRTEPNDGISGMTEKRVPKLYHYLEFKLNELNAYINGREFNEKYQEKQSNDINNTPNTANDPVNFASQQESIETLNSPKTILTNKEALKLRPFVGDMPRIAVASEHTDPVFFSKKIIKILNGEEAVQDRYSPNSYTGKDFNALYLITKHDGLPLKELLEQPIPKIIHFSITGLGGTKWEPGVMKPNDLLDRIADFIKQGLDPEMVTVRIDPIVPGVTSTQMIENIVKRASEMGIKKIRYSVMDRYKTTSKYVEAIGYDYSKYYPQGGLHATQEVRDQIDGFMVSMKEKYGVELFTCAEPNSKYADKISKEACLSVAAVNNMLGTSIPETATGNQRQLCSCFGGKTDLLRYDNKCASSCVYCYAHHNLDKNLNYYNEDGTLKDNPFTRTSKQNDRIVVTGSASTTAAKAKEVGGIDTLRHPDSNGMHFGNPFSHTNYQGVLKVVPTVKDAVIAFEQWLRGEAYQEVEPERRQWIVDQINNGSLKGKPIVYYTNTVPDNSYGVTEYNAQTAPNHAHILQKLINEGNIQNQSTANPSEFTNHSGGAYGGDTMWDILGRKYGVQDHRHYRDANDTKMAQGLRNQGIEATVVTKEQMDYARQQIKNILGKEYPDTVEGNKQVRNYYQAANADAVYAVATLSDNKKGVTGGTNTAVQLGIKLNKPVFVWDLTTEQWYKYDGKQFSPSDTPTLTKNFAGVGTRDIENYNIYDKELGAWVPRKQFVGYDKARKAHKAIDDVYKKTFGEGAKKRAVQLDLFQHDTAAINVYSADKNGYEQLSNFEVRPFSVKNNITGETIEFKSVEQAFQFTKALYYAKNQEVAYNILRPTTNSWEIKNLGRTVPMTAEQIEKWNKVSTGLLYRLMKTSFIQNESAKQLLLSTGDAVLTHKNQRGQEQDGGRFSRLLTQIRNEIRQMEEEGNEHKNNC